MAVLVIVAFMFGHPIVTYRRRSGEAEYGQMLSILRNTCVEVLEQGLLEKDR
jgi:hypothetical protein